MGCIAITGNDMPEMLNEITPHNEANDNPMRKVGNIVNINTPKPWHANTNKAITHHMRGMPQLHGKCK